MPNLEVGGGCPHCERYREALRFADLKLQDERQMHLRDLRAADQRAVELALTATEQRFDPVIEQTRRASDQLAALGGRSGGLTQWWGWLFGLAGITIAAISLITR